MQNLKGVCWCVDAGVGSSFGLGVGEQPGEKVSLGRLVVGENYVWRLAIVTMYVRNLDEQKGDEEGGFKIIIYVGMTSQKGDEGWSNL